MSSIANNKDLKIEIRPIPNRGGIRKFSEELEYFSERHTIIPYVNKSRKYVTGLNEADIKYLKSVGVKYDLDDNYITDTPHPLWDSQEIKVDLLNTPTFLYPYRSPLDYIKWKFISVSEYVYSSESEMEEGGKPQATHYIFNEEIEDEIKAKKLLKNYNLIQTFLSFKENEKRSFLTMVFNEDFSDKSSDSLISKYEEAINDKPDLVLKYINNSPGELSDKAFILKAIAKGIIRKNKKGLKYFDVDLGFTVEDAYNTLNTPDNVELFNNIKEKLI